MLKLRKPEEIFQTDGEIENGTFHGRWHFSFDMYYDPAFVQFGKLRVLNDDTLSPGTTWPLHPHREIEVVTYCAAGEFRHADEHGVGGVLQKGWVQHTTIGKGMYHAEINNRADESRDPKVVEAMNNDPLIANEVQPTEAVAKMVRADERLKKEFPLITLPVLILHGTHDKAASQVAASTFTKGPAQLTRR